MYSKLLCYFYVSFLYVLGCSLMHHSEVRGQWMPSSVTLPLIVWNGSHWIWGFTIWSILADQWAPRVLLFPPPGQLHVHIELFIFYIGASVPRSGPQACTASTLATSSDPWVLLIIPDSGSVTSLRSVLGSQTAQFEAWSLIQGSDEHMHLKIFIRAEWDMMHLATSWASWWAEVEKPGLGLFVLHILSQGCSRMQCDVSEPFSSEHWFEQDLICSLPGPFAVIEGAEEKQAGSCQ